MANYKIIRGGIHEQFLNCRAKIQFLGGGFGNGKTAAVCVKALTLATVYPGSNGLIARESFPKLNDTIRKEFYKWVPAALVKRWPTKDDNTLIFNNGTTVNFRYIQQRGKKTADGFTTSNLLSATYDWAIIDQIEDPGITYKDFLDILGRLRGSTPYKGDDPTMPMSGPRWFMVTSNPTANWVYKKLIKPYHKYLATGIVTEDLIHDVRTMEPLIKVIEGSTYENQHNLDADFIQTLEAAYKGQMKQRFLMGEWAAFEGLVYPDYSQDIHVVSQDEMLKILERGKMNNTTFVSIEGFDLGLVKPSCYLLGFTDHMGRIFILDGFYKPTPSIEMIGSSIIEIRAKYADYFDYDDDPIWADPALWKRTVISKHSRTPDTVAKLLRDEYDFYMRPAQNVIESGIMKVTEYLASYPHMKWNDRTQEGPLIYFADKLDFIDDEFNGYFWQTNTDGDRIDKPKDGNDHAMDTIKYMLSKLPEASKLLYMQPEKIPEWMKWQEIA